MRSNDDASLPLSFRRLAWSNLVAQSAEQLSLAATPMVAVLVLGAGVGGTGFLTAAQTLALELGRHRIRVNAICPVMGATGLLESFMGVPDTPENRARFIGSIPLGRMSTPLDIANAALWLASDESS